MTTLVVAEKCGQLGNRLLLSAHIISLAAEHGFTVWNPAFCDYAIYFAGAATSRICRFPCAAPLPCNFVPRHVAFCAVNTTARALRRVYRKNSLYTVVSCGGCDPSFDVDLSLPPLIDELRGTRFCLLFGWRYRNYDIFHRHADLVRRYFTPIRSIAKSVNRTVSAARRKGAYLVGVHIRQGDYKDFLGGKYFLPTSTYVAAMRRMCRLLPETQVRFLVCSSNNQFPAAFADLDVVFGSGHLVEDLYALAQCDYIMGVPSTFSRWASFFGQVPLGIVSEPVENLSLDDFSPAPH